MIREELVINHSGIAITFLIIAILYFLLTFLLRKIGISGAKKKLIIILAIMSVIIISFLLKFLIYVEICTEYCTIDHPYNIGDLCYKTTNIRNILFHLIYLKY